MGIEIASVYLAGENDESNQEIFELAVSMTIVKNLKYYIVGEYIESIEW